MPFLLITCLTVLFGCESLINDLDPDKIPKTESKLTVECYISPQSARLEAIVTQSQPLFGPANYDPQYVKDARVFLSDGQNRVQLLYVDSTTNYTADSRELRIEAGKTYTLTVEDGERSVKASCTVPLKLPVITNLAVEKNYSGYGTDSVASVKFSWDDIKGESNFYAIRGYSVSEYMTIRYDGENSVPVPQRYAFKQEMYLGKALYNDINLDGITYNSPEYTIYLIPKGEVTYEDENGVIKSFYNNADLSEVRVEVLHLDENYYRFFRSLENNRNQDNPFVEPTLIYTNIEGGLGCFGAYNMISKTVDPAF